ncbi:MAG: PAS domain-containing protein [Fibrobacteria bacterium]
MQEKEEMIRLLLNSTGEAIYALDLEGRCTICNPTSARLLGYGDCTAMIGKKVQELIHCKKPDEKTYQNGIELAECFSYLRPETQVLLVSDIPVEGGTEFEYLPNEFTRSQLINAVHRITAFAISETA